VDTDYEDIQQMERSKPYVMVQKNGKWGIYDIEQHRMEIGPTYTDISRKGKYTFFLSDKQHPETNNYLTMFAQYHRYQARFREFYELTYTIPIQPLTYDWSKFESM